MNEFPNTFRIAAYVRVSTEEQKLHGLSIETQTKTLQEWADSRGLRIVGFYNDAGNSARKRYNKRPELVRLLCDVQAGKIDLIIFTKLDRWFRSLSDYYKVQEILEAHNVQWKAIHEDYDTSTASGRLKINILLSVAQDEADRDSERIRAVFESKKERLEPLTGHVPFGYRIENKKVIKDPETEAAVAYFFQRYLALRSISLAREQTNEKFGTRISYQMADAMLRKEAYCGAFHGVPGMSPAYITPEERQSILAGRRDVSRRTKGNRVYLFSGLLRCGGCGSRMIGRTHQFPRNGKVYQEKAEYNCPGHYTRNICDSRVNIAERDIEDYLTTHVEAALEQYILKAERLAREDAPDFTADIAKIKRKLTRLKELYVNDLLELESYRQNYEALTQTLTELEEKQQRKPPDLSALRNVFYPGWTQVYVDMSRLERREFWRKALSEIRVSPDRQISVFFCE